MSTDKCKSVQLATEVVYASVSLKGPSPREIKARDIKVWEGRAIHVCTERVTKVWEGRAIKMGERRAIMMWEGKAIEVWKGRPIKTGEGKRH